MRNRKERMRAMTALIDAIIAVAPFTLITVVALPIASVGESLADVAENSNFSPLIRIVLTHEDVRRR